MFSLCLFGHQQLVVSIKQYSALKFLSLSMDLLTALQGQLPFITRLIIILFIERKYFSVDISLSTMKKVNINQEGLDLKEIGTKSTSILKTVPGFQ